MIKNAIFASKVFGHYLFYLYSQRWSRKKIESYQDKKLINIVKHAAENVPYYKKLFRDINLDPTHFKGRIDMHKIPLLDKEILRTRQEEFIAENAESYGINWESTSGSTGTPLHLINDDATKAHEYASVIRCYQWGGYFPGKKVFSIQSYKLDDPNSYFKHFPVINLWRFDAKKLNEEIALKIIADINKIRPSIIIGYPFSIFMISKIAEKKALSIHPPESIITAGETLSNKRREFIESNYKCHVFDFYGMHELIAMVVECKHHTKHLCEDFSYHEIIEYHSSDSTSDRTGELIGTTFYNYAMPLIRYRTRDTVRIKRQNYNCKCGIKFSEVEKIIGRQNDYLKTPDGRLLGNVLEHSVDNARGVVNSQCVQDAIDHIYLNLIIDKNFNNKSKEALENGLRGRLGDEIKIDFKFVNDLEKKKNGKAPFLISKIGHEYI